MALNWVFGYGSIMNPESATRTLGRPIQEGDFLLADLHGYRRRWNLVASVRFDDDESESTPAAFLNIEPATGVDCVGVLLRVTVAEQESFDLREAQYDRVDVTGQVSIPVEGQVFTYIGRPEHTVVSRSTIIPGRYVQLVQHALRHWNADVARRFEQSTVTSNLEVRDGEYRFVNPTQNRAAGREDAR